MFNGAQTLLSLLQHHAARRPGQVALATIGQPPLTYRDYLDEAVRLGATLRAAGIGADQRVALAVPDGAQMVFGMVAAGATTQTILVPPTMAANEFAEVLRRTGCDLALVHADHPAHFKTAAASVGTPVWTVRHEHGTPTGTWQVAEAERPHADTGPGRLPDIDDVAIILSSSGTTGKAKLVPRTHRNVFHFSKAIIEDAGLTPNDVAIIATPNHLSMGSQATAIVGLHLGGQVVVNDGPYEPANYLQMLREFRPTFMTASPVYFRNILASLETHKPSIDTGSVQAIRVSSDAMPDDVRSGLERRFGVSVDSSYSSSEALSIAVRTSADNDQPQTYLGRFSSDAVQILDDDGNPVEPGQVGEITVSHPAVSPYYIDDPELTARVFDDGRYRMGDLGYIDENGGLHFVSRKADIINRGGLKVAPSEVERALADHPAIDQCAAFALPHASLGEEIALAVVPAAGHDFSQMAMHAHLASQLGAGKWPRRLFLVDDLPRNTVGKVLRRELTARFGEDNANAADPAIGTAVWTSPEIAAISGLWAYILEVPYVAPDTSFIEAGGDSLQATILHAETDAWFSLHLQPNFILSPACTPTSVEAMLKATNQ